MSDDDYSRAEQRMADAARKRQAAAQAAQPPPSDKVTVTRVGPFSGTFANSYWLSQAWSPDGSQLAYGGRTAGGAGVLQVWNGASGHHEAFSMRHLTHGLTGAVTSLSWSPDGKHLATVEEDKSGQRTVHVRGQAEGSRLVQLPPGLPVSQVAWSPDGAQLALSGPACPQTVLADPVTGAQRRVIDNLSGPVAWQPGGGLLAGRYETTVLLCDPATGGHVGRIAGQEHRPTAVAWARRGSYLAVSDGEHILVWDTESGKKLWDIPWTTAEGDRGPDGTVTAIQWLDGGGYLLEFRPRGGAWHDERGTTCASAILWDIKTGKWLFVELFSELVNGARRPVAGLALAPDHRRMALAVDDHHPVIWRIAGDLPHYVG